MDAHSVLNLPDETRMLDVLREGFAWSMGVDIAVSFTRSTGLQLLKDPLEDLIGRGVRVRLLTSTYLSITEPQALWSLLEMAPGIECRLQQGPQAFHPKLWLLKGEDKTEGWVGSSNLTRGGLSTNLEWNLRTQEPHAGAELLSLFERIWEAPSVLPLTATGIQQYERQWRAQTHPSIDILRDVDTPLLPNEAQKEALERLIALRQSGMKRAAIIAATGLGKTYLAAFDALAMGVRRLLYVSHRLEHLLQARDTFQRLFAGRRRLGILGGGYVETDVDFLFSTIDSLRNRPNLIPTFDYLILDEFHHAAAESYQILRPLREKAFLLGLTATPERSDGKDVLEWCDQNIAYEVRLSEAIERQWLVPFHYFGVADETADFSKSIPWRGKISLELLENQLSIKERVALVLREARRYGYQGRRRATVGFCVGVRHAQYMAAAFQGLGEVAIAVTGTDSIDQRRQIYRDFADPMHPLEWLFVADVLNEGVDIPAINSLLLLRPTESPTIFLQQLGRGLRLYPETDVLTVLDFVGHHRAAWLPLQTLDTPTGGGRRVAIGGQVFRPPMRCEIILQRRTLEILQKVKQHLPRREVCLDAYRQLRLELGRAPMPIDFWKRSDLPAPSEFRKLWSSWFELQTALGDKPDWAATLATDHPIFAFLRRVDADWQLQRVGVYALLIGLSTHPDAPDAGYAAFFENYPQMQVEKVPLNATLWDSLRKDIGDYLVGTSFIGSIKALGADILGAEVQGRVMYHVLNDYETRHCGRLSTPETLRRFALYRRPEIIRHFGMQYDPAKHNRGIQWFDTHAVIICKLDTSNAKAAHHYRNQFEDDSTFLWTTQNQMTPHNAAGQRVLNHQSQGEHLHLFVQEHSHSAACYMGIVSVISHEGEGPMLLGLRLTVAVPEAMRALFFA